MVLPRRHGRLEPHLRRRVAEPDRQIGVGKVSEGCSRDLSAETRVGRSASRNPGGARVDVDGGGKTRWRPNHWQTVLLVLIVIATVVGLGAYASYRGYESSVSQAHKDPD